MIKAILIDDEQHCIDALAIKLKDSCPEVTILGTCKNVQEGLAAISSHQPDLIFLDISMPQEDGFTLLEKCAQINFEIIFTTAYDKYAVKAFEFSALHFLLKPIDTESLTQAIQRFKEKKVNTSLQQVTDLMNKIRSKDQTIDKIALPTNAGYIFTPLVDIIRLQAESNYTDFYLTDGSSQRVAKTLKEYEQMLEGEPFSRIHKSHLINLRHVTSYKKTEGLVTLSDGTTLEVSARKKPAFLEEMGRVIKI